MKQSDTVRAKKQARTELKRIMEMVKRLEHCQKCNGKDCGLTDWELYGGLVLYFKEGDKATKEDREEYHNEEKARQAILEDPLSVQVRSGWADSSAEMEAEEFEILLCTGGPACRIIGELARGEPTKPELSIKIGLRHGLLLITHEEREALLTYARQFYYGRNNPSVGHRARDPLISLFKWERTEKRGF